MTEQEVYRSILQRMLDQTEEQLIDNPKDFLHQLTQEIKATSTFTTEKH
ncbi:MULTISPECIES: hypothetical protein [Gracilibacillus]|nr:MULTISPECIES: hypothetical protein [Gracilibacillus]